MITPDRKPPGGELTDHQKAYNYSVDRVRLGNAVRLRCLRILVDQAVDDRLAADPRGGQVNHGGWRRVGGTGWALLATLVGSVFVVVATRGRT